MFRHYAEIKERHFSASAIKPNLTHGFFKPFSSFSDFRRQLKSPLVMPIVDLSLSLVMAIEALRKLAESAVNLAFLDVENLSKSVPVFFQTVVGAIYFAVSTLVDPLVSLLTLATRSLSSVVSGAVEVLESVSDCCVKEQSNTLRV